MPDDDWQDAGMHAYLAFERLSNAKTLGEQADAYTDLTSAMGDLATFLPGYDIRTGLVHSADDEPPSADASASDALSHEE